MDRLGYNPRVRDIRDALRGDPLAFATAFATVFVTCCAAGWIPARRPDRAYDRPARVMSRVGVGSWALGVGSWALGVGSWALGVGSWALGVGSWALGLGAALGVSASASAQWPQWRGPDGLGVSTDRN